MLHFFARRMKESREDERGFTLIELLVVVIIIGILAAIAIPTFIAQRGKAESSSAKANIRTAATAEQVAFTETGAYVAVGALGPYGYNAAGADPAVDEVSQSGSEYCFKAVGGSDTWYMDQTRAAPTATACT